MRFYRSLKVIKAITFDLDDTLYDNKPVMQRTEQQVALFLHQHYPELCTFQVEDFKALRNRLREKEPEIYHDVSYWRWRSLYLLLINYGYNEQKAEQGANEAMNIFNQWRSQISVPEKTHQVLSLLMKQVPLVAITNGNADVHQFGLDGYFQFILSAGMDGRAKPYGDMFLSAVTSLHIDPANILHVGDDLNTDITGAIRQGLQACWLNESGHNIVQMPVARLLPHIEISDLASLCRLL